MRFRLLNHHWIRCGVVIALAVFAPLAARANDCLILIDEALKHGFSDLPAVSFEPPIGSEALLPHSPFPAKTIDIPTYKPQKKGAPTVTQIIKGELLGKGGFSSTYEVKVKFSDGTEKKMAWREVEAPHSTKEGVRVRIQNIALQVADARSDSAGETHYIAPVSLRVEAPGAGEGYLMDLGGPIKFEDSLPGGALSLLDSEGNIKTDLKEVNETLKRIGLFLYGGSSALKEIAHYVLVHRDIKDLNFILMGGKENTLAALTHDDAVHVGLIDFGGVVRRGAVPEDFVGTPGYIDPEVLWNMRTPANSASDIYALMVTVTEMFVGPIRGTYNERGVLVTEGMSRSQIRDQFKKAETTIEKAGASPDSPAIKLIGLVRSLALRGLLEDIPSRVAALTEDPSPALHLAPDGKILGPSPEFLELVKSLTDAPTPTPK